MKLLKTPCSIKNLVLPNRLVMPPMATAKSTDDGKVTDALCEYYAEKSAGGYIGLIITEHSYVSQEGKAGKGQISIAKDEDVDGLKRMVSLIHANGSKVFAQINHAGGAAKREITGCTPLGASSLTLPPPRNTVPTAMTAKDIEKVIADFASAAKRAKAAGYDGVEIHSAHGYLLNQFYSPLTNNRSDRYDGHSIQGRIALHLEVIAAVRQAVGNDYPLALRLGGSDYMAGGSSLEDAVLASMEFEKAGIDLLDISGGFCSYVHPTRKEPGYFGDVTEAAKKTLHIPVILTGGITDAEAAERLLEEGKADLIGVGRAILANSDWAKRAVESLN